MLKNKVEFKNNEGINLAGTLELPLDQSPVAYAIFTHCFTCTQDYHIVRNISGALTRNGIAVLRFDLSGLGKSEGDFSETNFSTNVDDILSAANYLEENYTAPEVLIGHSFGGTASIVAAQILDSVNAVITIGSPAEAKHLLRHLKKEMEEIESQGEAFVKIVGRKFKLKKQFIENLQSIDMKKMIQNLNKAILILHSPLDETVSISNAGEIYQHARHPKSFVSLDKADHLLTNKEDAIYVGHIIHSWLQKYIDRAMFKEDDSKDLIVKNSSVAKTEKGFYTEVYANGHRLTADEPIKYGGSNLGPSPYDLLASALSACTSMTIRMYIDRKKWPLESVIVTTTHKKIHAKDCEECETDKGKVDVFERDIELIGSLTEEQKEKCLEIADKCPVHRTLHSDILVHTKLL